MKIGKLEAAISGVGGALERVFKGWQPPPLKTETEYRDALIKRLRDVMPEDARIEKEYRHKGTTVDVYLRWKGILSETEVFFELKRDLKRKAEFDRLAGQIQGLDPEQNIIVIVLIGELDAALVARLKERFAGPLQGPGFPGDTWMRIVEVP